MSESDSWSAHGDGRDSSDDRQHARVVAEQMRAATSKLRARLSLVRDADDDGPPRRSG